MTTSGTTTFNLDLNDAVEEAFERCGAELRTGYDLRTARRSLNLLFADWANRGINMWTFNQGMIPLVQGTNTYTLPSDTVDLLEHVIRTGAGNVSTQVDRSDHHAHQRQHVLLHPKQAAAGASDSGAGQPELQRDVPGGEQLLPGRNGSAQHHRVAHA